MPEIRKTKRVFFLMLPSVHLLDLSGPAQGFYEANRCGGQYNLTYVSDDRQVTSAQGLTLSDLQPLAKLHSDDTLVVPGVLSTELHTMDHIPIDWIREANQAKCRICSICSGAFVLAHSGLLDGKECTTHWKVTRQLQRDFPKTNVIENRLFVRDGNVTTSAGESAGIDMTLALISDDFGASVAAAVAREMVVYLRRDSDANQDSLFVSYRNHVHTGIHKVQDWIGNHPQENPSIDQLAELAGMSRRNLTRVFRQVTGTTIRLYINRIKIAVAKNLIRDKNRTVENVAHECGFSHPRHFRRIWKQTLGLTPSAYRNLND